MADAMKTEQEQIQEKVSPTIGQIPFSLVEKHNNKTTRLVASSGNAQAIEGQNRWYVYEFSEPAFIYRVVVNQSGYPDYKSFEIRATDVDGKEHSSSAKPSGSKVYLDVNHLCTKLQFKPPKAYLSDTSIVSIEVYGFLRRDAGKFIQFARDVERLQNNALSAIEKREEVHQAVIAKAQKAEEERVSAVKEVANLKSAADRQKAIIRRLESERADLTTRISVLEDTLMKNTRERDVLIKELQSRSDQKEDIESQIFKLDAKLSELKANVDLFPSELDSFVRQGARNTRTLFWLALAPIFIICVMFGLLISGAVDLTTKITDEQNINIVVLVVSRMPYVIVSLAIITACYKIARFFISELIQINRQRLNLTKVSIIAKDVSVAAEQGLDLSDSDRYNLRLRLKMDLLKDHLKGYITPNLEVSLPRQITTWIPSRRDTEEEVPQVPDVNPDVSAPST